MNSTVSVGNLPNEILLIILINLELPDLLSFCGINHQMNLICNDEYFWLGKLKKDFPLAINDENISSKDFYQKVYKLYKEKIYPYIVSSVESTESTEHRSISCPDYGLILRNPILPFDVKKESYSANKYISYTDTPDVFFIKYEDLYEGYRSKYDSLIKSNIDYIGVYRERGSNKRIYELLRDGEGVVLSFEEVEREINRLSILGYIEFNHLPIRGQDMEKFIKYGFIRIF
jgi:hypothetical protein